MAKQVRIGKVVSRAGDKTVVVKIEWSFAHPLYRKRVRRVKKFMVHDEKNELKVGDRVCLESSKPYSRRKCFVAKKVNHDSAG